MADYVLLDEIHVSFRVPTHLDDAACDVIRRILESRQFRSTLRRAIRDCILEYPELAPVRIRISV